MATVSEATVLVCLACGGVVTTLSIGPHGLTILRPCGHSDGYKSVPMSALEHGSAA